MICSPAPQAMAFLWPVGRDHNNNNNNNNNNDNDNPLGLLCLLGRGSSSNATLASRANASSAKNNTGRWEGDDKIEGHRGGALFKNHTTLHYPETQKRNLKRWQSC